MKSIFIQQFLGSSFVSPALGGVGQGRLNINDKFPPKKIWAKPKQAGKKEGGLGEGIFARPPRRLGWESVSAIPASAGRQNRKIFVSLIEKIFCACPLKNVKKIFLFCSPSGEQKRWAGLPPCGRQLKVAVRIFVKKGSDFVQKVPPIFRIRLLGDCCLAPPLAGRGGKLVVYKLAVPFG